MSAQPPITSAEPQGASDQQAPQLRDYQAEIQAKHDEAVKEGRLQYADPQTGYYVWTEVHLKQRGSCCSSGCRHCPYGFKNK